MGSQNSKTPNVDTKIAEKSINFLSSGSSITSPSKQPGKADQPTPNNLWNTTFRWPFGGDKVEVTGTFTNWKNHVQLAKVGKEFSIIIKLPPGIYQYKYIVDGEWKYSPNEPIFVDDKNNTNNIIDTLNYNPKISDNFIDKNVVSTTASNNSEKVKNALAGSTYKVQEISSPIGKNINYFNSDIDFEKEAPVVPPHLLDIYFLSEKDTRIRQVWKKDETKEISSEGTFRTFDSFNTLSPPTHVILNHLGIGKVEDNFFTYVITERFKAKYATIKFYTSRYLE